MAETGTEWLWPSGMLLGLTVLFANREFFYYCPCTPYMGGFGPPT
jgi:hypothetical protein